MVTKSATTKAQTAAEGAVKTKGTTEGTEKHSAASMKDAKQVLALIDKAITGVKTTVQSLVALEALVHDAASGCILHAEKHGDTGPADRLMKGLEENPHPLTKNLSAELAAWFREFSPIRWNAKKQIKLLKEGDPDYAAFNTKESQETPFNKRPQAIKARAIATNAGRNALKPVDTNMMQARLDGNVKFLENAKKPDANGQVRGIANGQDALLKGMAEAASEAAKKYVLDYFTNNGKAS
jgi:hypothetical protein